MDILQNTLQDPAIGGIILSVIAFVITQVAKQFKIDSNYVAFGVAIVFGTIYVLTVELVPQGILDKVFMGITSILGATTGIYTLLKKLPGVKKDPNAKNPFTIKAIK